MNHGYYRNLKKQLFSILIIRNVSWAPRFLKDHVTLKTGVIMLKMWICHHRNELRFKICSNRRFFLIRIFHYIPVFFCIFDQINAPLLSIRDFFQKLTPNFWALVYARGHLTLIHRLDPKPLKTSLFSYKSRIKRWIDIFALDIHLVAVSWNL